MKNLTWDEIEEGSEIALLDEYALDDISGGWGWHRVIKWVARGFFTGVGGALADRLFNR